MIRINGYAVDCEISYETTTERLYKYEVETLDGKTHVKHYRNKQSTSCKLLPRSQKAHDEIMNILNGDYDFLAVEYPSDCNTVESKEMIIRSFSCPVEKRQADGSILFGEINISYEER